MYGHDVESNNDRHLNLSAGVDALVEKHAVGGVHIVDIFPVCKLDKKIMQVRHFIDRLAVRHLPTWFPGAGFKREALSAKRMVDEMMDWPFDEVRKRKVR